MMGAREAAMHVDHGRRQMQVYLLRQRIEWALRRLADGNVEGATRTLTEALSDLAPGYTLADATNSFSRSDNSSSS